MITSALNPVSYAPQSANFPLGQSFVAFAANSNIIECAFKCSQAYVNSRRLSQPTSFANLI